MTGKEETKNHEMDGGLLYPEPTVTTVNDDTDVGVIRAIAVACVEAPPPLQETVGTAEYPTPGEPTESDANYVG